MTANHLSGFLAPAIWGFVIGFVGWSACLRLIEPVSTWLLGMRSQNSAIGSVRVVVLLFLVGAVLLALALPAVVFRASGRLEIADPATWRALNGIVLVASLCGALILWILRRWVRTSTGQ